MLLLGSQSFPHYGLERFFRFAAEIGFEGVEIMVGSNFDTQNPTYLKELEERFKMPIRAFSLPNEDADQYLVAFEKVVAGFGGKTINLAPPDVFSFKYKRWIENAVPRFSKRHRLTFNRRNVPSKPYLGLIPSRSQSSLQALRNAGDVCLDLPACRSNGDDIMQAAGILAEKLQHVNLGNVHHGIMYAPLTLGDLPVESFLTKLSREGYRGDFTLKLNPKSMHAGDDEQMTKVLKESYDFFFKYFTFKPG
jgi:sugar phosphate isomerase/epimerase